MAFSRLPVLIGVVSLLSCELNAAKRPAPAGTLGGKVAANGVPVAQAVVHVWIENHKDAATIHPDEKGEFHFPLAEGTLAAQKISSEQNAGTCRTARSMTSHCSVSSMTTMRCCSHEWEPTESSPSTITGWKPPARNASATAWEATTHDSSISP